MKTILILFCKKIPNDRCFEIEKKTKSNAKYGRTAGSTEVFLIIGINSTANLNRSELRVKSQLVTRCERDSLATNPVDDTDRH